MQQAARVVLPVLLALTLSAARLPAGIPLPPAPVVAASPSLSAAARAAREAAPFAGTAPASPALTDCPTTLSIADAARLAEALPRTSGELLKLLSVCGNTAKTLISDGQLGVVHLPAMLAKDIAIALEGYTSGLTEQRQAQAANAVKRLVVAAWKLITYGELRNREKLLESYDGFAAAIADINSAYDAPPSPQ